MVRNALLIGRVGERSIHRTWIDGVADAERVFDLHLSYYGGASEPFPDRSADTTLTHDPGAKFPGLSACIDKLGARLDAYKWICFVDDDIWAPYETWRDFFAVCDQLQPQLAQPALMRGSFYSHDITLVRRQYTARWTNFVEIMNFCFDREFLRKVRTSFDASTSGWGVDYLWAAQAEPKERSLLIVDKAPVLHTRAVGKGGMYDVIKGGVASARGDRVGITETKPGLTTYAAVLPDGSLVKGAHLDRRLFIPRRISKLRKLLNINIVEPPRSGA
jgi:hypothetical protein